jgi:hypothetical protein
MMRKYARNMAEHRQNMALLSPLTLIQYSPAENGKLNFNFERLDKAVQLFIDEGVIGRIEGNHIGGRIKNKWENQFQVTYYTFENGKLVKKHADPCSPEANEFYSQFLPALVNHLKQKNWLDKYVQHIADEPTNDNYKTYGSIVDLVRKYAPEFKIIEACQTSKLTSPIDIWVPQLDFLKNDFDYYKQRQKLGDELWFYTCMYPQGEFANRFIELPLWKTRILHWINFKYGITGYLHWGYNSWNSNPFKNIGYEGSKMPDGDPWVVYPGVDGPLDSIRFEAMRDGVADYELLCILKDIDEPSAMKLASKLVLKIDKYNCNVKSFRQTRHELLEALSKK